ncbi:adaptin N terminal region-domain-containing protein [Fimicolochytrium jonesii]|uniref:adaptin N terminal region-domain-containing protein n=1 Tax=Fimicolochytrium jonesii TaxID=1396493 RepID=UPI0022FDD4A3|nr:adaptin N terminal region-domain-containing protein [Fimicolochytrium jonesii]KAI8827281.1 adaptin N terminal region-domain-containing protein [Fimicolochytrium jonesii]
MDKYIRGAASLASEAGKFSMRLTQEIVERSREVGVHLPGGSLYDTSSEGKTREIRTLLDSKFDKEKIDGLKRLIAMMSKGRNVKEFFPDVVKLVASQSFEVRKLVYIYLLRYAEAEPDLALLSINTFQKDLADRNPLIRAMALRVMSSIRVQVIVPIIMLALRKATTDLSPYVRKAAANAIPKCYSLDTTQKEYLVELIETMLKDNSTLVLGSVLHSMKQVCPERLDLIHPHYRKLCRMLVDADEWGQITIMDVLIQYARVYFVDPNPAEENTALQAGQPVTTEKKSEDFYAEVDEAPTKSRGTGPTIPKSIGPPLDPDHELLVRWCTPLLNSRNCSVVLTVAKLFFHVGTPQTCAESAQALIRLLRTSREERYIILLNIATMAQTQPSLFKPYVRHFFLFGGEPSFIRDAKLEIIGVIAGEENATMVMSELKEYVRSPDSQLVIQTIQVLGRLACRLPSVTDDTLSCLMKLVSKKDEGIVSAAVVVIRRLLQSTSTHQNTRIISQLAKNLDTITSPQARASVLWLIGQYCASVPKLAPDALRISAKRFADDTDIVKLQVLTLAAKLVASTHNDELNSAQEVCTKLLRYVLDLARFDQSWDVRDRARMIKALVAGLADVKNADAGKATGVNGDDVPAKATGILQSHLQEILLGLKATPVPESPFAARNRFDLGTLSHTLNRAVPNYKSLPAWPPSIDQTAAAQRNVEEPEQRYSGREHSNAVVSSPVTVLKAAKPAKRRVVTLEKFYDSDSESEEEEEVQEEEESEEEESEEESSEEEETEGGEEEEEEDSEEELDSGAASGVQEKQQFIEYRSRPS